MEDTNITDEALRICEAYQRVYKLRKDAAVKPLQDPEEDASEPIDLQKK